MAKCILCRQEKSLLPNGCCQLCEYGRQNQFRYECQRCHIIQKILHPMWFYQKNPDSFSSESWACQGCGHYTSWKILDDDFRKLPDDKYPESWEYLKRKKQIEGKEFVLADVQRIQDEYEGLMNELKVELDKSTAEWNMEDICATCSHLHVERWGEEFACSGCHKIITVEEYPEKYRSETEFMKKLGADDKSESDDAIHRGLSIRFLLCLCIKFKLWKVTTRDVLHKFIIPLTKERRCRFVELEIIGKCPVAVGTASIFISHCNMAHFGDLVRGLIDLLGDWNQYAWVDIFAVRQWPSSKGDLHFDKVIEKCDFFIAVCPLVPEVEEMKNNDLRRQDIPKDALPRIPFYRIWCLFEMFCATKNKNVQFLMITGSCCDIVDLNNPIPPYKRSATMLQKMLKAIDIKKAGATVSADKDRIFEQIETEVGIANFDNKIQSVIATAIFSCDTTNFQSAVCSHIDVAVLDKPELYILSAAASGNRELLIGMLTIRPNLLNHKRAEDGINLLIAAVMGGQMDVVEYLVSFGVDINQTDISQRNALMYAAELGRRDCAEILIKNQANLSATDIFNSTALLLAAQGGHFELAKLLAADVQAKNFRGDGILDVSLKAIIEIGAADEIMYEQFESFLDFLIGKGFDMNKVDAAYFSWNLKFVNCLIKRGAFTTFFTDIVRGRMECAFRSNLEIFYIASPANGRVLDNHGGNKIVLWKEHGEWNQMWVFDADGTIMNPGSGKVLHIAGGEGHDSNGTEIQLCDKNGQWNQQWVFVEEDKSIMNPRSRKVLQINLFCEINTVNGEDSVQLWERNGQWNQQWVKKAFYF